MRSPLLAATIGVDLGAEDVELDSVDLARVGLARRSASTWAPRTSTRTASTWARRSAAPLEIGVDMDAAASCDPPRCQRATSSCGPCRLHLARRRAPVDARRPVDAVQLADLAAQDDAEHGAQIDAVRPEHRLWDLPRQVDAADLVAKYRREPVNNCYFARP